MKSEETARIGVFGGTFDPIHLGHVEKVREVCRSFEWSRFLFVPTYCQQFKVGRKVASAYHRFAMTALALEDDPRFEVSPVEVEQGRVNYTADTLALLAEQYPGAAFDFVVGDDHLPLLPQWKGIDRVFELANLVIIGREEHSQVPPDLASRVRPPAERGTAGSLVLARSFSMPVSLSSTAIRERVRNGLPLDGWVHPRVAAYIAKHGLYRD